MRAVRRPVRLGLVALAAAVGLSACGGQSLQAQSDAAKANLADATSVAVTVRLDDPDGGLSTLATQDGTMSASQAKALLGGSFTVQSASTDGKPVFASRPSAGAPALDQSNIRFVVRSGNGTLGELRTVGGVVYLSLGTDEIQRLATEAGAGSVRDQLTGAPEAFVQAYDDLAAGKWLSFDVKPYVEQLTSLGESLTGGASPAPVDPQLYQDLVDSIQPHVGIRDLGQSGSTRDIEVTVQLKRALTSALDVLSAGGGPLASVKGLVDVDALGLSDATVKATLTVEGEHFTAFRLPLAQLVELSTDASADDRAQAAKLGDAALVVEIDDNPGAVTAPTDLSSLDLNGLLDDTLAGFGGLENLVGAAAGGGLPGAGLTPGADTGGLSGFDPAQLEAFQACLAAGTDPATCDALLTPTQ